MDDKAKHAEFFSKYYSDSIIESSEIMFKHLKVALEEIKDKNDKVMDLNDVYRALSYVGNKVLNGSFAEDISPEKKVNINKVAMEISDSIIEQFKSDPIGKELAFTTPLVLMDIMAFKEFEYNYSSKEATADDAK